MESEPGAVPAGGGKECELVRRIWAGDSAAEVEFVATYHRPLLLIAAARTRDREAAKDLAQEVLMAVLKALRQGEPRKPEKLTAFVHGTARNVINNYIRARARRLETDLDPAAEPSTDPVKGLELAEQQQLIRRELKNFDALDQQILLLSWVDGHSLLEVAQRLHMSHDAVRARRSRMIRKLMEKFNDMSQK